ncbi:phosphatidylinositol 3,4,5-trisphosphate 3-phosphatase and dual-specificity protein phosphatase PTEN isoform X3 [Uranotaenia lowii]|uniref:phosphatidylinositol 3,4,5-trisphosphate 3-phosphatase and dual-specificity protein phosphatase PTEN isoform X3 n=1 Tax=Uranotaenia lowii TaxID=190385 RepID=UPI00247A8DB8|nr:phosphatidylinositol 3,4,5-trisphosphate 3-phosphatase and dual-specificity protein phosphatase PTEN isoform X3 [Uranotaenia lowii]
MTNAIRVAVSKNRHRYKKDGFDLDLSYINERIIAMGYPAEKVESFYRNKIDDVHKMLEMKHHGCYKVYNLCSERSYDAKRFPSYSVYPFKDHNPPDIELITAFCRDVDEYLRADPKNVVAVHCKAGKGRTGTMISCYLMYSRQFNTAGEALDYYAQQRTNDAKGVTIPSQRRYVEYYASLLQSNELYRSVTLYLCEIRVTPGVNIREGSIHVNGSDLVSLVDIKRTDDATVAKLYCCMPLNGDVKIEFLKSTVLRKEKGFHFWFNTFFVAKMAKRDGDGNLLLTLSKTEIDDAHKDKQHKVYPKNFTVQMVLQTVPAGKYSESVSLQKCHPSSPPPGSIQMQMTNTTSPTDGGGLLVIHSPSSPLINCNLPPQTVLHPQVPSQFHPPHRQQLNNSTSDPYRQPGLARAPLGNNHQNNHNNHNQLDENNHSCVEYSETSSSESSTEEEGWDSGSACSSSIIRRHQHHPPSQHHTPHHHHDHDQHQFDHRDHPPQNATTTSTTTTTNGAALDDIRKEPSNASASISMKSPMKKPVEFVISAAQKLHRLSTNAIFSHPGSGRNHNSATHNGNEHPTTTTAIIPITDNLNSPESLVRYRLLSEPEIVTLVSTNGVVSGATGSDRCSSPSESSLQLEDQDLHHHHHHDDDDEAHRHSRNFHKTTSCHQCCHHNSTSSPGRIPRRSGERDSGCPTTDSSIGAASESGPKMTANRNSSSCKSSNSSCSSSSQSNFRDRI